MVRVYQQNHVGLSDLLAQGGSVLRSGRRVDDGGDDIFLAGHRRDGYLGENCLDLARVEGVLDHRDNQARLARTLVAADANANIWTKPSTSQLGSSFSEISGGDAGRGGGGNSTDICHF